MVPLTVRDRHDGSSAAVLSALRAASERLDAIDGATVDRLFALEATIRAGRIAAPLRQRLGRVQRDSSWRVGQSWLPDVPHAVELAQLSCVIDAEGTDLPEAWSARLSETCAKLARRRSRFNATTDVVVLSTLIRGLAAVRQPVPQEFIDSVEALLDEPATGPRLYELSDAIARHREHRLLAERVAQRAFSATSSDPGDAVARWWLAERWRSLTGEPLSVSPTLLDTARRQSLATTTGADIRVIGMTIEVMGRASESLVIETAQELAARASRGDKRRDAEIIVWRFGAVGAMLIIALINTPRLLGWILGANADHALVQGVAGVLCAATAWVILRGLIRLGMLIGVNLGDFERGVDILVPVAAGVVGWLIYR